MVLGYVWPKSREYSTSDFLAMYGKALFFIVLVVLGAVLPYLLADDEWLAKIEEWMEPATSHLIESDVTSASPITTKPTTANKPVPIESYKSPNSSPTAMQMDSVSGSLSGAIPPSTIEGQSYAFSPSGKPHSGRNLELPRVNGPPGVPIENLISFQVTPDWISKNWSRVTTRLAELDLQGWRVPVAVEDRSNFIGSITYYFDQQRNVQRIQLHGYTTDASSFIELSTSRYEMRRVPHTLSELYAASVQGQTIGGLRVDYKPILKSEMQKRCEVLMELNRQQTKYGMSYEFEQILKRTGEENRLLAPMSTGQQFFATDRQSRKNSLHRGK